MAAPSERYVDPSIAADSGAGTIGDPWGDLQYGLNQVTRDATNGDRFNIKAGTAEILAAQLSLATYGTPTADAPIIFQGYTSAAGDGGIGDLNGNAGNFTLLPNVQFILCRDLKIRNSGTAQLVTWTGVDWNALDRCEFSDCDNTTRAVQTTGVGIRVMNCHFSGGFAASTIVLDATGQVPYLVGNYFNVGAVAVSACLSVAQADRFVVLRNIIRVGAVAGAMIRINNVRGGYVAHNSILGAAATGQGILLSSGGADGVWLLNNLIEGFSGTGGDGLEVGAGSRIGLYQGNAFYNNTAHETGVSGAVLLDGGDNETLSASPFAKSGANTFANRGTYFAPVDTGNVWGGAYPIELGLDKGAVQHAAVSAGGGGSMFGGHLVRPA